MLGASRWLDACAGSVRTTAELNSVEGDALYVLDVNTPEEYQEALTTFGLAG